MRQLNHIYRLILLLIIQYIIFIPDFYAQIINNSNGYNPLEIKFVYPKIEVQARQSFFNILTIKNTNGTKFTGKVQFDVPSGWNIVGESGSPLNISAGDSINIPVRVLVSSKVVGEIAYVLVASISDASERHVKSEYCFITVPRIADTKIKLTNSLAYFDQKTNKAVFQYAVQNKGNINEIVNIQLQGPPEMSVNTNKKSKIYSEDFSLPPHSDTTILFNIGIDVIDDLQQFYKIDIKTSTQDTIYTNSIWLNRIDNVEEFLIPEKNKCAIIELTINDMFSEFPSYTIMAKGAILFKYYSELYYFYQSSAIRSSEDYWGINTRAFIGFNSRNFGIQIGNLESKLDQMFYGRGANATVRYNRTSLSAFHMVGIVKESSYFGGSFETSLFRRIYFRTGYAEMDIDELGLSSKIALAGIRFRLSKRHNIGLLFAGNETLHTLYSPFTKIGTAYKINYNSSFRRLALELNLDYGSPDYTGSQQGKLYVNSSARYSISKNSKLEFNYYKRDDRPSLYINDVLQPERYRSYDKYELFQHYYFSPVFNMYYGPVYQIEGSNQFFTLGSGQEFLTHNRRFQVNSIINIPDSKVKISPRFDIGNILVMSEAELDTVYKNSYLTFNFSLSITAKYFGFYMQYRNGPYDLYEQYHYTYSDFYSKRLFLMPYYERFFFNKKLEFRLRANYQANFTNFSNVASLNSELALYLPRDFSVRLLNNMSTRTQRDIKSNISSRYNSNYFQLTLRKEFNCRQPRVSYHNLNVIFFRDLNGNRVKEPNEPGINNVLASIESNFSDSIIQLKRKNEYVSTDLLSDQTGTIQYINLPNGDYTIKYVLIGEIVGNFNREVLTQTFSIDDDKTIYIPYLENNKIFGSVVLNRDPLSSLGNIDISNIRVIAEDTKGNSFSALTDKQGNFILYTPVADNYIVKINNVFYESFDLQQNEFIVKFNGYKQFQVSFVFNEKKRKISFDNDVVKDEIKDDLKVIKKTTLTGKIRDAISLEPIEAKIKIIENSTNRTVAEAISNRLNGNYSISYVAGDNFRIEVKSEGHWDHVENLYIEQIISIQNIAKDIILNKLSDGPKKQTFIIYDQKEEEKFTDNFKSGQQIPINNLNFDEKDTRLSPNAYPDLDRLIEILNKNKSVRVEVAGHADDTNTERTDNILAMRRAKAVARYLTEHGISENRIEVKSYSNQRPLSPSKDEKARQKNRRVEIIVL